MNKHIGCSILLDATRFSIQDIVLVSAPTLPRLQGRAGFVRVKQGKCIDIAFICVYFPTEGSKQSKDYNLLANW
eukprot:4671961-Heterocapsa_arctica.AAC.1